MTWYDRPDRALCFECTGCGACCQREGEVYVTDEELDAIARFARREGLKLELTHVKLEHAGLWSIPIPAGGACPLLDQEGRCSVHEVKPWQCRAYPFWPEIMQGEASWREEGEFCEGIGRGASHAPSLIDHLMGQDPFLQPEEEQ